MTLLNPDHKLETETNIDFIRRLKANRDAYYRTALELDNNFMDALKEQFPNLKHYGDIRYQSHKHNDKVKLASLKARETMSAYHDLCTKIRHIINEDF